MKNSESHDKSTSQDLTPDEVLDFLSARYDLEIQRYRETIQRLRKQQAQVTPTGTVDFVIHPRRAA